MGAVDVVKALVAPCEKLIEFTAAGLGTLYKPVHVKRMAKAHASAMQIIGDAIRTNSDIPIEYNQDGLVISNTDYDDFLRRAETRQHYLEITKQQNIESVVSKTHELLQEKESIPNTPVDKDWCLRFFDTVGNVSDERLQEIWARLLAGEIEKPCSFSLRTIDILRNMSQSEAKLFELICNSGIMLGMLIADNDYLAKRSITYDSIVKLDDCGLIRADSFLTTTFTLTEQRMIMLESNEFALVAENSVFPKPAALEIKAHPLTTAGKELSTLCLPRFIPHELLIDVGMFLARQDSPIKAHIYPVIRREQNQTVFNIDKDILTYVKQQVT